MFPGQGSQRVGMGRDLAAEFTVARCTCEEAGERLSFGLSMLCCDGPAETLALTGHAQPWLELRCQPVGDRAGVAQAVEAVR